MTATVERAVRSGRGAWVVAWSLVLLSVIPVLGGAIRVGDLAAGAVSDANARFMAAPVPVLIHIVGATVYCLLGAFQFVPALRRRTWHRRAGRVLFVAGSLAALSGLWMTLTYPWPPGDGPALFILRLVFGTLMAASLGLGLRAILRRDVQRHRRWMTRAYAIGIAAGTQAVVSTAFALAVGPPDETQRAILLGGSWVLNLAIVELVAVVRGRALGRDDRAQRVGLTGW